MAIASLGFGIVQAIALDASSALPALAGRWVGDGLTLIIDAERLQANTDPAKPFQWDALGFRYVLGSMVVFDIGAQRFIGVLDPDGSFRVTQAGVFGQHTLQRPAALARLGPR